MSAWDPTADAFEPPAGFSRASSLEACAKNADALAVMTALPELANIDWATLHPARRLVIDGCMGVGRKSAEAPAHIWGSRSWWVNFLSLGPQFWAEAPEWAEEFPRPPRPKEFRLLGSPNLPLRIPPRHPIS